MPTTPALTPLTAAQQALQKRIQDKKAVVAARTQDLLTAQRELNAVKAQCKHSLFEDNETARCRICNEDLGWWCPKSKTHLCCYNDRKDPMHDFCLRCGAPEERK